MDTLKPGSDLQVCRAKEPIGAPTYLKIINSSIYLIKNSKVLILSFEIKKYTSYLIEKL